MEMSQGGFADCFKMNRNRNLHRTILAYVNQVFQQISGINVSTKAHRTSFCLLQSLIHDSMSASADTRQIITYYAATIFENNIGLTPFVSRLLAACNGTEYFLASFIALPTIERFGRRQLMLFGAAGQAACMAVLAGTTSHPSYGTGIVAAAMLFLFNTFFAIGWLGMTWWVLT